MPEIIDGQNATLRVGGELVGGITQYQLFQGSPPIIRHRPLSAKASIYMPAVPDYGIITMALYRNHLDPGQQQLADSQASRVVKPAVFTLVDGTILSFDVFCEALPLAGGKQTGQTINTSNTRLRVTGVVTTTLPEPISNSI